VKEGFKENNYLLANFKENNDLLANTLKGNNQPQQGANRIQNIPLNQTQQLRTNLAQPPPQVIYTQIFPQIIMPTNTHKINRPTIFDTGSQITTREMTPNM